MRGQLQSLLLLRRRELTEDDAANCVPAVMVTGELDRWLSSIFTRRTCHELYEAVTGISPDDLSLLYRRRVEPAEVRRRLARAFFDRELVAVALGPMHVRKSGGGAASGQARAAPIPVPLLADRPERAQENASEAEQDSRADQDAAKQKTQAETAWVGIELVDDSGEPVAGARYRLKLSDGSVQEGILNDNGAARVEGIAQGQCEISFPDLDADSWSPHTAASDEPDEEGRGVAAE